MSSGGAPINAHIDRKTHEKFARIAAQLDVSFHTVDTHLRNIDTKLQVHRGSAAVAKALKERLL